jgi:hypothetical protein
MSGSGSVCGIQRVRSRFNAIVWHRSVTLTLRLRRHVVSWPVSSSPMRAGIAAAHPERAIRLNTVGHMRQLARRGQSHAGARRRSSVMPARNIAPPGITGQPPCPSISW